MTLLILLLLIGALIAFVFDAVRSRSLIAVGLACWVLAEIVVRWP